MPKNIFFKLKKKLIKEKHGSDVKTEETDRVQLRRWTSEKSLASSEGSGLSDDDGVYDNEANVPEKARSEGTLHKLSRKLLKKKKRRFLVNEQLMPEVENRKRSKSDTDILSGQNNKTRSRSLVKSLLCVIPETGHSDSDTDTKYAQSTNRSTSNISFNETSSNQYLPDGEGNGCELNEAEDVSKESEDKSVFSRSDFDSHVVEPTDANSFLEHKFCDSKANWEAQGARPKTRYKSNSTQTSGISSMEDCLAQSSEDPMVDEYVESTLLYTLKGRCPSSPGYIQEDDKSHEFNKRWKSCTDIKASNVQINNFGGGASDPNISSPPIFAVNPVSAPDKMNDLQVKTDVVMKTFAAEENVANRNAFDRGICALTTENRSRVVILVGHKGDGKTTSGKYILNLTDLKHRLLLSSRKEWQAVKIKEKRYPNTAIFIDDMFGADQFHKHVFYEWQPVFDQIYAASTMGNVSTIIGIDKKVFERYLNSQNRHKLFSNTHVIDLTADYALTRKEKRRILMEHLRHFSMAKTVSFCDDKKDDNTANFVENRDLFIWKGTLEQIAIVPYPVGFPTAAAAFASSIENIKQGVEYFYSPQISMVVGINEICQSSDISQKKAAFAIGTLVQRGGKLNLRDFQAEENTTESKKRSSKPTKNNQARLSLSGALKGRVPTTEPLSVYFREGLDEIRGNYVDIENDAVTFRCVPIHYSAAISFGKEYAADVIAVMPFDFISKYVGPHRAFSDRQRLYITLDSSTYQVLFERLLKETKRKNVRLAMEHSYMGEKHFVSQFLKYISKECKMQGFLQIRDGETNLNVLCHGMARSYQKNPDYANCTEHILKTEWNGHMKRSGQREFFEKEAVKIAAMQKNVSTFEELVKHVKTFDTKCFDAVIQSGSKQLFDILLKYKNYSIDLLMAMKSVCKYHFKKDPKMAVKFAKYVLSKESSLMVKKAIREAKKFANDSDDNILKDFLSTVEGQGDVVSIAKCSSVISL